MSKIFNLVRIGCPKNDCFLMDKNYQITYEQNRIG